MKTTILVVEDEAIVAADLKLTLERLGYDVAGPVDTGEEAIVWAKSRRPDLVLMDIKLKGDMDGIEAAAKIKEFDIPVIYLSGYVDEATIRRAKEIHTFIMLHKPFDEEALRAAIELGIGMHKTERELREKNEELEEANKLMVGREMKMIELKEEIISLKKKLAEKTNSVR